MTSDYFKRCVYFENCLFLQLRVSTIHGVRSAVFSHNISKQYNAHLAAYDHCKCTHICMCAKFHICNADQ